MTAETTDTRAAALAKLREEFPAENIAKLPKVSCWNCTEAGKQRRGATCPEHSKKKCPECSNYLTTGHVHLDYVGHAETTDRFLDADLEWNWRPMALDQRGLPAFDDLGGMWIYLTIGGIERLGYGSANGKKGPDAIKEVIGDALRNAGMRFGVALNLWAKTDLHADEHEPEPTPPPADRSAQRSQPSTPVDDQWSTPAVPTEPVASREQVDSVLSGMRAVRRIDNDMSMRAAIEAMVRHEVTDPYRLTPEEAADIIATLTAEHNAAAEAAGPTPNNPAPTAARVRMMHATFKTAGIDDHDGRVGYANWVIGPLTGRAVDTTSDLTAAELTAVCQALGEGRRPELAGRAAELAGMVAAATTSEELAAISERIWEASRAGTIDVAARHLLLSASVRQERTFAQHARAAA